MRRLLVTLLVAGTLLTGCGKSDAGKNACIIYRDGLSSDPRAIVDMGTLAKIKPLLSGLDDKTRTAFAGLLVTADANPFTDPDAADGAALQVRTTCLSEHGVDIPSP